MIAFRISNIIKVTKRNAVQYRSHGESLRGPIPLGSEQETEGGIGVKRIQNLGQYQKGLLIFMAAMVLVFAGLYFAVIRREGFEYRDQILVPREENGGTVYSGKIEGEAACFTVSADGTIVFQYGSRTYGPYTVQEDPTATPSDPPSLIGVELRRGQEVLFRGGMSQEDPRKLYCEDGSVVFHGIVLTQPDGEILDGGGNSLEPMEPAVSEILELAAGPELTHKGDWLCWLYGAAICVFTAISILFVEELFRWRLSFSIRRADQAEPSDWEIASRYIGWTVLAASALVLFIVGLR